MMRKTDDILVKYISPIIILFMLLFLANLTISRFILFIINLIGIYIIATLSLNLTNGYAGLFSLGHAGFMSIGAYVSTILTFPVARKSLLLPELPPPLNSVELPFIVALLIGGLVAALAAFPIGFPVLRLRGHYLAVATLGFMVVVEALATNLINFTRGPLGINGIPSYSNSYWIYGWVIVTILVIRQIVNSRFGRSLMAIREDELAAEAFGTNLARMKLLSFVVGAFFAGIAGGLLAHLITAIVPWTFSFALTFEIVIMLIVGGMGSISGSILGATMLTVLKQVLKPIEETTGIYGIVQLTFASILIITMIKKPSGILGYKEISLGQIMRAISGRR